MSYFDDNEDYFIFGRRSHFYKPVKRKKFRNMSKDPVIVVRGELNWAKIVGKARPYTGNPKYDKGPYWSVDLTPDAKGRALLKANGIDGKLKTPKDNDFRKESFIQLRVLENRPNGEKNDPPKIVDIQGNPWDDSLLGNGTVADVMIKVKDYGPGSDKGSYLQKVRILDHVPYDGAEFEELSEDDEFFARTKEEAKKEEVDTAGESPNPDDLDDDIPF